MPLTQAITDGFATIVGTGSVLTKLEDIIPYSFDGTAARRQMPAAVVFPQTTEDVSRCVTFAVSQSLPIVTRGSGTGLSGGSIPTPGSLVLCLAQMNAILDLDPRNLTLRGTAGRDYAAHRRGGGAPWPVLSS
jgi:glycolate oxidase